MLGDFFSDVVDCSALRDLNYFRVEGLHTFHLFVVSSYRSAGAARQCWEILL
jgi:hypothetical protein